MKINLGVTFLLAAALTFAGCARNNTAKNGQRNYNTSRVTYTGSSIPQDPNRVPDGPVTATTPSQSFSRGNPSLYPTDPVVGANAGPANGSGNTGPYTNTGAGPAGSHPLPSDTH